MPWGKDDAEKVTMLLLFTGTLHCKWSRTIGDRILQRVKYWEAIADNLSKDGWSWGCVSAIDSNGRTIWIPDAHRGHGKRRIVRADEKLTALLELESAVEPFSASSFL